jgi:DNA-binding beta-propeller fold protein YncE
MSKPLAFIFFVLLAGCAVPGDTPENDATESANAVWPQPPSMAKIRFQQAFSAPQDLGLKKSVFRRLRDAISGADERRMVRPYAVSVYEERIAVADPGAGAIHLYDTGRRSYRRLVRAGDEPFRSPVGIAVTEDRVYVADSVLNKVFVLDKRYRLEVTLADFGRPTGLAFDAVNQRLFVADTLAHRVRVFDANGTPLFSFGERGTGNGQFNYPSHLSIAQGMLLVNDTMNFRIQIFDLDGAHQTTFGKHGDGSGSFAQPKGVAIDSDGHIYVADAASNTVQIFDQQGVFLLSFGFDGDMAGGFRMPTGVTIDGDRIYVADSYNQRVQVFQYLGDG